MCCQINPQILSLYFCLCLHFHLSLTTLSNVLHFLTEAKPCLRYFKLFAFFSVFFLFKLFSLVFLLSFSTGCCMHYTFFYLGIFFSCKMMENEKTVTFSWFLFIYFCINMKCTYSHCDKVNFKLIQIRPDKIIFPKFLPCF